MHDVSAEALCARFHKPLPGLGNQAIARRLSVAPRTAEAHVENLRRKLQVHSRTLIAAWITKHRLRPGAAR
ncbi:MAG: response regulator transcription factor [Streptosporangiaceae bacterium]